MRKHRSLLITVFSLLAATGIAGPGHSHAKDHGFEGPNRGRILTEIEPHAELFVQEDRRVRLTFVQDDGTTTTPPADTTATLVTGSRRAPVTLTFEDVVKEEGSWWVSSAPLPEGSSLPAILRLQHGPEGAPTTVRLQLNLAACAECKRPDYTCRCDH